MKTTKVSRRMTSFLVLLVMVASMFAFPVTASAEEHCYSGKRYYLGHFDFTNVNRGSARRIHGNKVQVSVAFKKASYDPQSSNIDLYVRLERIYYANGLTLYLNRWDKRHQSEMVAPDASGYHYFVSDWIDLNNENGELFCFYYDAMTAFGQVGNGNYRSADVHMWIDVG